MAATKLGVRTALPFVLCLTLIASVAHAGKDEQMASLGASAGRVNPGMIVMDESRAGFAASLSFDYRYGLNDTFSLRASVGGGPWFAPDGTAWSGSATLGLVYVFDVLRYVPHLTVGGGVLFSRGGGVEDILSPIAEVGGGLDILESRSLSWGAFVRVQMSPQAHNTIFFGLRGSYRWGYF